MEKLFQVLVQKADEGHWDEIYKGSYGECVDAFVEFKNNPENDGIWMDMKIVSVKAFSDTELHIMYMALSQYYNELIDQSYGEYDLIQRYMDEKNSVILKLERLTK